MLHYVYSLHLWLRPCKDRPLGDWRLWFMVGGRDCQMVLVESARYDFTVLCQRFCCSGLFLYAQRDFARCRCVVSCARCWFIFQLLSLIISKLGEFAGSGGWDGLGCCAKVLEFGTLQPLLSIVTLVSLALCYQALPHTEAD